MGLGWSPNLLVVSSVWTSWLNTSWICFQIKSPFVLQWSETLQQGLYCETLSGTCCGKLEISFSFTIFFSSFTQQNLILYIILMSNFNCCEKWKHNMSQLPWWTVVLLHSHLWAFIMFPLQVESCATASGDWFCIMGPVRSSAFYPTFLNWPKSSTQYRAPITPTWLAT